MSMLIDENGNWIDPNNPLPVLASSTAAELNKVGRVFAAHHEIPSLAVGESHWLEYRIGSRVVVAIDRQIQMSEGPFSAKVYENAIFTPSATQVSLPPVSSNRMLTSAVQSTAKVYHTPTAINVAGATLLGWSTQLDQGNNRPVTAGGGGGVVLKPNTSYLLQITNNDGVAATGAFDTVFMEL